MSDWGIYVVCECGWYDDPSFGRKWFTTVSYPFCPKCGTSTDEAITVKARVEGIFRRRLVLHKDEEWRDE